MLPYLSSWLISYDNVFCRFVGGFRASSSPLPTTMLQYRMVCLRQQNPPTKLFTRKSPLCVPKWIVYSHCRILGEDVCVCQDGRRTKRVVLPSKHQLEAWQMISNEFIRQQAPHKWISMTYYHMLRCKIIVENTFRICSKQCKTHCTKIND